LEYQRAWHAAHPGYAREAGRKHREQYPAHREYQRAWRQEHREELLAYFHQRRGRASEGMTEQDKAEAVEWRKVIKDDPCYYCGATDAAAYEDDHYVSIANGGSDHWWNLVRACQPCNRAKRTKNGDEFLLLFAEVSTVDTSSLAGP
jgi:5-methylcytosine-specific restriction endonuclease McrA